MISKDTKFLIVGLGLIGGSYAMGLKKNGYHVDAIEINQLSIDYALKHDIIDRGSTFDIELIQEADIIIIGLYPNMSVDWIATYQKYFKPGALITDVASVKTGVVKPIQTMIRDDVEYCSSHPMAGKEVSGVKFADDAIFHVANFIILPTEKNTKEAIDTLRQFASILGFSNISELSVEQHDEMIGFVSHLTHAIAVSLMNTNDNTHLVEYTGDSFRDLTRIAKINENLWSEVFFLNKENLIREIDAFTKEVDNLKSKLLNNDVEGLKELFIQSTARRKLFDK
ncbi:prephenate dehydrogenase [[Eubacterium] hominis]|uniref:prephenate dehydrogenase n=1 Tax=[Eubacterium] hominis TaxID=2764325 RepID=UPI003A4E4623